MIIVAGTLTVTSGKRDAYLATIKERIAGTLDEPGCIAYSFGTDVTHPDTIRVFEKWESHDVLDTHLGVLSTRPPESDVVGVDIMRYEVGEISPLRRS